MKLIWIDPAYFKNEIERNYFVILLGFWLFIAEDGW